jgi:hypothetical protein
MVTTSYVIRLPVSYIANTKSEDLVLMDTPWIILYLSDRFLRTLLRVSITVLRTRISFTGFYSLGSFAGMEYSVFFYVF